MLQRQGNEAESTGIEFELLALRAGTTGSIACAAIPWLGCATAGAVGLGKTP
jgi:hypothetical protein